MSLEDEEKLVRRVLEAKPGLTREELEKLVEAKIQEFGGIIGRDAALLLVAKELGVPVSREFAPRSLAMLRIRDLAAGFRGVDLEGVILAKTAVALTREGKPYARFLLTDEESAIWGAAWGDVAHEIAKVRIFSKVLLRRASVVRRRGRLELALTQGSQIEVRGELSLESAIELLSRFKAKVDVLVFKESAESPRGKVILCLDRQCRPVGVLLAPGSEFSTSSKGIIVSNYFEERLGELRVLKCNNRCVVEPLRETPNIACRDDPFAGVSARGSVACYLLFRRSGGKVLLIGEKGEVFELLVPSDQQLVDIGKLLNSEVEILGVYKSGVSLRTTPLTVVKVLSSSRKDADYSRGYLLAATEAIELEASLVSLKLKHRCVEGSPLYQVTAWVDDGTANMQVISNSAKVLQKLYGVDEASLCDTDPEAIASIANYVNEELAGTDVALRGQVIGSANRLIVVHDLDILF
ncbi:MAG: hypothetical protein QW753_01255 [Thermofilum sp.]